MANGYQVCPTCGCSPMTHGQPGQGPWQGGGQMWAGPAWGGYGWQNPQVCPPQPMQGPVCGPGHGPGYGQGYAHPYYGGLPTDAEIEEMIYDAIDADPMVPFDANIDVTVEAGTVYLRGEVTSKRIKHAAGDDAWWIPGVSDVHNEIKVTPRRQAREPVGAQQD